MAFNTVSRIATATNEGRRWMTSWRKSPSQVSTIGVWFDLSMSPGNPAPQYYASAPYVAVQMLRSDQGGIPVAQSVTPSVQVLRNTIQMTATSTALPMPMILCDYLLYYPFIDEGTTDQQDLTNTATLPRYTNGKGVQVMAVSVAGRTGGQSFFITYTNSDGVAGRISPTVIQNTATANGNIVTSDRATSGAAGPFIPLQAGDSGVRSIESVTMLGADVGLFTLVLVKPLAQVQIRGIDAPVENDHFLTKASMPIIYDNAYLNFICLPQGSLAATTLLGIIETAWD